MDVYQTALSSNQNKTKIYGQTTTQNNKINLTYKNYKFHGRLKRSNSFIQTFFFYNQNQSNHSK